MQTYCIFLIQKFVIVMVVVTLIYISIMLYFNLLRQYMLKYSMCLIHAAILQFPAIHKKKPQRSGYRRAKVNRKIAILC